MNGKFWFYFAFVFVVGLVAVGCGGGGGGGSANPVAAPVSTGSLANLTGVVSLDNQPLANAKVFLYPSSSAYMAGISQLSSVKANVIAQTLHNDGSYSTFSDAQGRYNFVSVPVGNYTLIAMKDQNHQFARTNVVLGAVTQVDAQLTPTGSVIGQIQIVNSENVTENVSGAIVYLDGTSYVAVSAIDGRFTIANVPANQNFTLKVISSRGVPSTAPSVTITPGLPSNAGTILLAAPSVPTSTISGSVAISGVAAPDAKLANHMILLTAANQPPLINLTDQSGQFAFIVRTGGAYRLTPIPEEYDSIPLYQDVNVIIGQNLAVSQVFALQAEPEQATYIVNGSLTKSEKAFNEADEGGVPITLTESTSGRTYAAVSIADGSFNFEVPAGEYKLAIGGGYALAAALSPNPFSVSAPYTIANFSIKPTMADALLVKGRVNKVRKAFNEVDAGGVPLTLTDFAGITYPAVSDADGYFSFYVPAGEYYISVGGGYAFQAHPFSGSSFVVSADYNFSAVINLVPTQQQLFSVNGSLNKTAKAFGEADNGGVPITFSEINTGLNYATVSAPDGSFNFQVPAGEYKLAVGGGYEFVVSESSVTINSLTAFTTKSIRPTNNTLMVQGKVSKRSKSFNESDEGGVALTLKNTDAIGKTYPAVTSADGSFAFFVPAGEYQLSVGGAYAFENHPLGGSPLNLSANYYFASTIYLVSTQNVLMQVQGNISKEAYAFDESDQAGVNLTLTDTGTSGNIFSAISDVNGYFSFEVPSGTYKLNVGGSYKLKTSPHPDVVTNDPVTSISPTIVVVPSRAKLVKIQGSVVKDPSETDNAGVNLTLTDQAATGMVYSAITDASGNYSFEIPSGTYQLQVVGAYKTQTAIPQIVTNAADGYNPVTQVTVNPTQEFLVKIQGSVVKDPSETDNAGVNLTLTDQAATGMVYSAITDASGNYSFEIPSGTYQLQVVGAYKTQTAIPQIVTNAADGYNPVTQVTVNPTQEFLVKIQGSVVKDPSETDNAGVNLTLTDQAATGMVYSAITDASGNYSFEIPSGTYQLQVVGAYKTQTAIPQIVTNAADGNNPVTQVTVNPTKKAMVKVLGQIAKVPVETDNAGVNLTLTDTSVATAVFSAVSDADGRFAFDVPSGTYKLNVGGNYKLQTSPYPDIVTNAEENGLGAAINVVPTQVLYTVTGSITKSSLLPGDTTTGPVRLILRSASVSYTTVTASGGNFTFRVVAGTYDLLIDGDYDFDSALSPVAISGDYGFGSQSVSPKSGRPAEISGQITGAPANLSEPFEVRLWDQENEKFVAQTFSVNDGSANAYSFKSLESGTYRVIAFPHKNGYFAETPVGSPIILADGEVLSGHNISAAVESPEITSINFPDSSTIELVGNRFASSTPDVAATKVFIGGNLAARPLSSDLATTSDKARINTLAPGTYTVELRYSWPYELAVGKIQTFVLKSNVFEFLKPIQPPTNLTFNEVTDTKIRVSWKNAPWTQNSEVEIWQGATQIGTTATVDGTSHEFTGLSAATGYEVRIRNRAGNIVSTNLTGTATTKTTASQQIQNVNIPIDYILSAGSAYDFVPGNDQLFILHSESVSTLISKFASDGSGIASFSLVSPTVTREGASLAFANNLLYLCYLDTNSFIKVESFDPATLNPVGTHTAIAGIYSEAQMIAADNKLFIACTRYSSSNEHELYYLPNPTGTTLGASQRIAYRSSTGLTNDSQDSYLAMVCADDDAGSLYFVAPDPDSTSNYLVDKFPLSNPDTASSTLAKIPSEYAGYGISVKQFKAANDKVFLRTYVDTGDPRYNYVYLIDRFGGFYEYSGNTSIFERRGEYHVDHKGRLWMAEVSATGRKFFVNLGIDGSIIRSLVAIDFINTDSSGASSIVFPNPANFIKEDPVTKATYMLYQRNNSGLAFYRYSSDF